MIYLTTLLSKQVLCTGLKPHTAAVCILHIPCLRTSSTAAVSSSLRNWLSFAIFSPFSRKFWVAVSTEAAKTWAFLERPFFLLEGPLLLEFTRVVTYNRTKIHVRHSSFRILNEAGRLWLCRQVTERITFKKEWQDQPGVQQHPDKNFSAT